MAINPEIALGVRPFVAPQLDIPDPVEQFGKVLTLQNLMQQRQAGALQLENQQLQLQQARQQAQERADLGKYLQDLRTGSNTGAAGPGGAPAAPAFDYGEIMRRFPTLGPGIVKAHHDAATAGYDEQLKQIDISQKQNARRAQLAGSITDEATKTAAIAQAQQEGLLTPQQRDQLLQLPFDNPQWKQFQNQALTADQQLTQAREAAKAEQDRIKFEHDRLLFPVQEQKAKLETAQAQRSADAMTLAGAFRNGPQAFADALNALPEDRRQPFAGAKTETDLLRAAMTPHEAVTSQQAGVPNSAAELAVAINDTRRTPEERALAKAALADLQRYEIGLKTKADAAAAGNPQLIQAVIDNPSLWGDLTPTEKGAIAAPLAARGFVFGKPLGESAITKISETKSGIQSLQDLRQTLKDNEQYIGPISGLQALNPWSEAKVAQAKINLVKQRVGKALEGGVLRKEDEEKYKQILATLQDTPSTAFQKVDSLITNLQRDLDTYIETQKAGGRRVAGVEAKPPAPNTPKVQPGFTLMRSPDGKETMTVPNSQVAHYKGLGATVAQ